MTALAKGLDLSRAAVAKLIAKGMPTSSVAEAQAWRLAVLHPGRRKRTRLDAAADDEAQLFADVQRLAREAVRSPDQYGDLLRWVLVNELTQEQSDRIKLPPAAWAAALELPWPPRGGWRMDDAQ